MKGSSIPDDWFKVVVAPIPKPGRDSSSADGYRPISLINCMRKLLEKVLLSRIDWLVESQGLLHTLQFGFRRGSGVAHCLFTLIGHIQAAFLRGIIVISVFADINAAYDNVYMPSLIKILQGKGFPSNIVSVIFQLFSRRIMSMKGNRGLVGAREAYKGVPQGSPLSPILFNLYLTDLCSLMTEMGVTPILYADDIVLLVEAESVEAGTESLNVALERLVEFLDSRGLSLSISKTKSMIFSRRRRLEFIPPIVISNVEVEKVTQIKYLGILFTPKLLWSQHINHICNTSLKAMNIIRSIASVRWGCSPSIILTTYRGLVRSRLEASTWLLSPLPKGLLSKLMRFQLQGVRLALGAFRSSPGNALLVEAGELPLDLRLKFLAKKFMVKNLASRASYVASLSLSLHDLHSRKNTPLSRISLVLSTYREVVDLLGNCYRVDIPDIYKKSFGSRIYKPRIIENPPVMDDVRNMPPSYVNSLFVEWSREHFMNRTFLYTDGSVRDESTESSFCVFIPSLQYHTTGRISASQFLSQKCLQFGKLFASLKKRQLIERSSSRMRKAVFWL